jgi:esterase/lipase superfamily enzyme
MGNRALIRAVQQASESARATFNQIFLAAPDIDVDTFNQLASAYNKISRRTTLYCSSKDKALKASGFLYEFPRAGLVPPITIVNGIDTIEVSKVDFSRLGHGYYAAARDVLQDMHHLIFNNTDPQKRFGLSQIEAANGTYWTFGS